MNTITTEMFVFVFVNTISNSVRSTGTMNTITTEMFVFVFV